MIAVVMMKRTVTEEAVASTTDATREEEVRVAATPTKMMQDLSKTEVLTSVEGLGLDQMKKEVEVKDVLREVAMKAAHKAKAPEVVLVREVTDLSHQGTQMVEEHIIEIIPGQITGVVVALADMAVKIVTKSLCQVSTDTYILSSSSLTCRVSTLNTKRWLKLTRSIKLTMKNIIRKCSSKITSKKHGFWRNMTLKLCIISDFAKMLMPVN